MSGLGDLSLYELFRAEVDTQAAVLNEGLLALERAPQETARIEPLMRAAHSIKGAARIVQLDAAVTVAHAMEDRLVAAQRGTKPLDAAVIDALLRGTDMLQTLSRCAPGEVAAASAAAATEREALCAALAGTAPLPPPAALSSPAVVTPPPAAPPVVPPVAQPVASPPATAPLADLSMWELFRSEVETQAQVLTDGLLLVEREQQPEALATLMRAAHSIKGAARMVRCDPAVQLAHVMEDRLVAAQRGTLLTADTIDALLRGTDLLRAAAQTDPGAIAEWAAAHEDGLAQVAAVCSGTAPAPAAAAVVSPTAAPPATSPAAAPVAAAVPAPAQPAPAAPARPVQRDLRLSTERLDRLLGLAGEVLVEARRLHEVAAMLQAGKRDLGDLNKLLDRARETGSAEHLERALRSGEQARATVTGNIATFEQMLRRSEAIADRLYREVVASRMRPFADGVEGFPRMLRDLARQLGKQVRLHIAGQDTGVDRDILERLEAPLTHLLRNALDHGIELPAERIAAGKPAEGTITLSAAHRAGMLLITLQDDGRGVDYDKLRVRIRERNLAPAEVLDKVSREELLEFLYLPGFSTAAQVSEISGRGVGMDVVLTTMQEVGGTIRTVSETGQGMCVTLHLPLTLSVIRALLVELAGEIYAFPLARLDRALLADQDAVRSIEGRQYLTVDGDNIGLISARQVLGLPETPPAEAVPVAVVSDRMHRYGLAVDRFIGEVDLVVKRLDRRLGKVPDISAAAQCADGTPVLIFDVDDLVRSVDNLLHGSRPRRVAGLAARGRRTRVLVVDDSLTVREVERKLLENHGYEVTVAVDGMDGWHAVREGAYDLVISDIDMPRLNGFEFVARLRAEEKYRHLPVIIVSYKDRDDDRRRGMEAGADRYLTKSSFSDDTLLEAVRDLAGGPQRS